MKRLLLAGKYKLLRPRLHQLKPLIQHAYISTCWLGRCSLRFVTWIGNTPLLVELTVVIFLIQTLYMVLEVQL